MSRPLFVPELLAEIFAYSSKASNAVNAQVCRLWYDNVKHILWRHVETLKELQGLLRLLGPWSFSAKESTKDFPLKADWSSFLYHANLVRSLVYKSQQEVLFALRFISDARPVFNLFPSLHTLTFAPSRDNWSLSLCSIFAHPGLKRLYIKFPSYKYEALPFALPLSQLQGLTRLEIEGENVKKIKDSVTVLVDLPNLETLVLPLYSALLPVLEVASMLPALQRLLSTEYGTYVQCDCEGTPVVPNFPEGCFPVLKTITIAGCVHGLTAIVRHPHFPASINRIYIHCLRCTTSCLTHFNKSLAETCTGILEYNLHSEADGLRTSIVELRPLFSCRLKKLDIHCSEPLKFSQLEFREFASSFPDLEELFLNQSPFDTSYESEARAGITLDMLPLISHYCPRLQRFGVLLNTSQSSNEDVLHIVPFSDTLQKFDIGLSPLSLENLEGVAMFLAHVIPSHCEIIFDEGGVDYQTWKMLANVLNALRKMKDLGRRLGERNGPHDPIS